MDRNGSGIFLFCQAEFGDNSLILCDSECLLLFSLWDLIISMNEKIYFKGFWLIGLGVGGGATYFTERDAKLIQLLINIGGCISPEQQLLAWRPLCARGCMDVQGPKDRALKSWPQKEGVQLFCSFTFSMIFLVWNLDAFTMISRSAHSTIYMVLHLRIHIAAGSPNISYFGWTCSCHAQEPRHPGGCAFVADCPK